MRRKINKKKLVLNKETIAAMEMNEVKGGTDYLSCIIPICIQKSVFGCTYRYGCTALADCQ